METVQQQALSLDQPLYSVGALQDLCRCSRPTIDKWVREGRLKRRKVGKRTFSLREDILGMLLEPAEVV